MQKKEFQKAFETCIVVSSAVLIIKSIIFYKKLQTDDQIETARRQRSINSKHADHLFNEKK